MALVHPNQAASKVEVQLAFHIKDPAEGQLHQVISCYCKIGLGKTKHLF